MDVAQRIRHFSLRRKLTSGDLETEMNSAREWGIAGTKHKWDNYL